MTAPSLQSIPTRRWTSERAALLTFVAIVVAGATFLLVIDRHQWFLTEDWVFFVLNQARQHHGDWAGFFLEQYRGHWITTTNVLYELAYRGFGLRHYLPYLLPTLAATCGISALLRVHMRRAGVGPWTATAFASLALFLAASSEDVAKAWQVAFTGALLFGLAQLLACDHDGPIGRRDAIAIGFGFLALITSGVGLLFLGIVALSLGLRGRYQAALVNVLPLVAVYIPWYLVYGRHWTTAEHAHLSDAGDVLQRAWHALSVSFDAMTRAHGIGGVLAVVLVVSAIVVKVPARRLGVAPVVALAVGAPAFLLFAGTTSFVSLEVLPARYLHVASLLVLPLIAVVWSRALGRRRVLIVVGIGLVAVATVANAIALANDVDGYTRINELLKPELLAMASIPDLSRLPGDAQLSEPLLTGITVDTVERLQRAGAFPSTAGVTPAERFRVNVDLSVQLVPPGAHAAPAPPAQLAPGSTPGLAVSPNGCVVAPAGGDRPHLVLDVGRRAVLPISNPTGGALDVDVRDPTTGLEQPKSLVLPPGTSSLRVDLPDVILGMDLPVQGPTEVCGVRG